MFLINQNMPKTCNECPFIRTDDKLRDYCCITQMQVTEYEDNGNVKPVSVWEVRHPNCPLLEVVHGKWEFAGIDVSGFPRYSCSNCNMPNFIRTQYCPNCGAIMTITK